MCYVLLVSIIQCAMQVPVGVWLIPEYLLDFTELGPFTLKLGSCGVKLLVIMFLADVYFFDMSNMFLPYLSLTSVRSDSLNSVNNASSLETVWWTSSSIA